MRHGNVYFRIRERPDVVNYRVVMALGCFFGEHTFVAVLSGKQLFKLHHNLRSSKNVVYFWVEGLVFRPVRMKFCGGKDRTGHFGVRDLVSHGALLIHCGILGFPDSIGGQLCASPWQRIFSHSRASRCCELSRGDGVRLLLRGAHVPRRFIGQPAFQAASYFK